MFVTANVTGLFMLIEYSVIECIICIIYSTCLIRFPLIQILLYVQELSSNLLSHYCQGYLRKRCFFDIGAVHITGKDSLNMLSSLYILCISPLFLLLSEKHKRMMTSCVDIARNSRSSMCNSYPGA